jgi:hypothetical protein
MARSRREITLDELWTELFEGEEPYDRLWWEISSEERAELDRVRHTNFAQPESEQLQEFISRENHLDWNGEQTSWWATYTFAPPIIVFIVGTSLVWALRGFRRSPP